MDEQLIAERDKAIAERDEAIVERDRYKRDWEGLAGNHHDALRRMWAAEDALGRVRKLADAWDRDISKFPQKWRDDPSVAMLRAVGRDLRHALEVKS